MLALLIGPPGGGKSYEAVVYHVLPAIEAGRKVITNLSINMEEIAKIEPRARLLLDIRTKSRTEGRRLFDNVADYEDDWRHPETGQGAFFAIDEAHKAIPRLGMMHRDPNLTAVEEFMAEHRHRGADVLFMSQSIGKMSKNIVDQVQVTYRVKKMTLFGNSERYLRKVQDGVRGDVMSTSERIYEPKFYKLYKSHTMTEAAVIESDSHEITPAHLKWKRASRAFLILGALLFGVTLYRAVFGSGDEVSARTQEHAKTKSPDPDQHDQPGPQPASSPRSPPSPVISSTRRIVGIVARGSGFGHAMIYDGQQDIRISLHLCKSIWPHGWECEYGNEIVTEHSGKAPQTSAPAGIFASFSGGSSQ